MKKLLKSFLRKRKWKQFREKYPLDDPKFLITIDVVRDTFGVIDRGDFIPIPMLDCRGFMVKTKIDSLYDLLIINKSVISLLRNGESINRVTRYSEAREQRLDLWMSQPLDGEFGNLDLFSAVLLIEDQLKELMEVKGSKQDSYIERQCRPIFDCYITLVIIVGDLIYGRR